jgi:ribosomal protein L37E
MEIKVTTITCKRCGYTWVPRKTDIRLCAKCKTPYFDRERKPKNEKEGEIKNE